jgi:hypothetical protein
MEPGALRRDTMPALVLSSDSHASWVKSVSVQGRRETARPQRMLIEPRLGEIIAGTLMGTLLGSWRHAPHRPAAVSTLYGERELWGVFAAQKFKELRLGSTDGRFKVHNLQPFVLSLTPRPLVILICGRDAGNTARSTRVFSHGLELGGGQKGKRPAREGNCPVA